MKKISAILALVVLSLGACLWLVQPAAAVPGPTPQKFAGAWYATGELFDGENLIPFAVLSQFSDDGTITSVGDDDFVFGDTGFDSPQIGSWVPTGPNSADAATLYFSYDANGNPIFTGRIEYNIVVSDFQDGVSGGEGVVKIYLPGMDPLDPDAGIVAASFTYTSRRVKP